MESINKGQNYVKDTTWANQKIWFFWDPFTAGVSCTILEGQTQFLHYFKYVVLLQVILLLLTVLRPSIYSIFATSKFSLNFFPLPQP